LRGGMRDATARPAKETEARGGVAEEVIETELRGALDFLAFDAGDGEGLRGVAGRQTLSGNGDGLEARGRFLGNEADRSARCNGPAKSDSAAHAHTSQASAGRGDGHGSYVCVLVVVARKLVVISEGAADSDLPRLGQAGARRSRAAARKRRGETQATMGLFFG
jgi:hypothetical protein